MVKPKSKRVTSPGTNSDDLSVARGGRGQSTKKSTIRRDVSDVSLVPFCFLNPRESSGKDRTYLSVLSPAFRADDDVATAEAPGLSRAQRRDWQPRAEEREARGNVRGAFDRDRGVAGRTRRCIDLDRPHWTGGGCAGDCAGGFGNGRGEHGWKLWKSARGRADVVGRGGRMDGPTKCLCFWKHVTRQKLSTWSRGRHRAHQICQGSVSKGRGTIQRLAAVSQGLRCRSDEKLGFA